MTEAAKLVGFTVCSLSSLSHASALHETFETHHPGSDFCVALSEDADGLDTASLPFTVLRLQELGLPDASGMAVRYDSTELRAALKPFAFQVLFDRHPESSVLFLDPEVYVTSRFAELFELIADGAECVLTPAITEPAEHEAVDDLQVLRQGTYHLGFCCLTGTPSVRRIVWWWARRQEAMGLMDSDARLSIEERWADLFPAFIEGTRILRHPGYNVGYWNLSQRLVRRTDEGWSVNGLPLRCFNASGLDAEADSVSRRPNTPTDLGRFGTASDLLAEFRGTASA